MWLGDWLSGCCYNIHPSRRRALASDLLTCCDSHARQTTAHFVSQITVWHLLVKKKYSSAYQTSYQPVMLVYDVTKGSSYCSLHLRLKLSASLGLLVFVSPSASMELFIYIYCLKWLAYRHLILNFQVDTWLPSIVTFRSLHFVRYISFVTFCSLHFVRCISFVRFVTGDNVLLPHFLRCVLYRRLYSLWKSVM